MQWLMKHLRSYLIELYHLPWKAWLSRHHLKAVYIMIILLLYIISLSAGSWLVMQYQGERIELMESVKEQLISVSLLDEWVHSNRYAAMLQLGQAGNQSLSTVAQRVLSQYPLTVLSQEEENKGLRLHLLGDPTMYVAFMDSLEKEDPLLIVETDAIRAENHMVHIYCRLSYRPV